jgi:hypothetical protein
MANKTRSEFSTHDEWLAYVDLYVPTVERANALAAGRIELLKLFYELRNWPFPSEFSMELNRIHDRGELESSADLELLNEQILKNLTVLLFNHSHANASPEAPIVVRSTPEPALELRGYITNANPYFRLWMDFKNQMLTPDAPGWDEYLAQNLGPRSAEEIEFSCAMAELDKLLEFFQRADIALPKFSFERLWFLHHLRAPERMLQTRSVLTLLTAEIEACTSA